MTTTLLSPDVTRTLDRIFARADAVDAGELERVRADIPSLDDLPDAAALSDLLADAALPVCRDVGRFLYQLARRLPNPTIVEFGTSHAVSTIHLAAAVVDGGGGGRVVTSELHEGKAAIARSNLDAAGVGSVVDVRVGDARETLDDATLAPIDLVFLDGWKDLYLPVLELLEPLLAPGAIVVADDLLIIPEQLVSYLAHVRDPENGFVSVALPVDDGIEVSTWIGRA